MKKLLPFMLLALFTISCNDNDDAIETTFAATPNPTLLTKIIFYPGLESERHWNFYPNGLLKEITSPSGSIIFQSFTYDNNGNLTSTTASATTHTFTYDSNNRVTSVDGYPVTYDSVGNKYVFHYEFPPDADPYDFPNRTEIALNADGFLTSKKVFYGIPENEYFYTARTATYLDGNMVATSASNFDVGSSHSFDGHANPLKTALAPISRVMILADPKNPYDALWVESLYTSQNNVMTINYAAEDPESNQLAYEYNDLGLPTQQGNQGFYHGVPEGEAFIAAYYQYQQ